MYNEPDHTMGPRTTADSNAEGRMVVDARGGRGSRQKRKVRASRDTKRRSLKKILNRRY